MLERILSLADESGKSDPIELRNGSHWYPIEGFGLSADGQYSISVGEGTQSFEIYKIGLNFETNELRVDGVGLDGARAWVVEE